jgi:hypothetical protein
MRRTGGRDRWVDSYLAVAAATARKFLMVSGDWNGEPHFRELEPAQACATSDPSPATDRVDQHGEDAPVGWSAESSPWCVTVTGCRRRGAKGDIVAASCLHDPPDRVHNDLWLVDRYHVTGLSSDHQTSSFRERGEILLQLPPILISSSCTGDDDDRDREFPARASDFRHGLPNVNDFVSCRLVSRRAEPRCQRVSLH